MIRESQRLEEVRKLAEREEEEQLRKILEISRI